MVHWVLGIIIERQIGYSEKAMEAKRHRGVWLEYIHWRRAPDGRIVYNIQKIQEWMINGG